MVAVVVLACFLLKSSLVLAEYRRRDRVGDLNEGSEYGINDPVRQGTLDMYLPITDFSVLVEKHENLREEDCAICMDSLKNDRPLRQITLCKHCFHYDCLVDWYKVRKVCPLCKITINRQALRLYEEDRINQEQKGMREEEERRKKEEAKQELEKAQKKKEEDKQRKEQEKKRKKEEREQEERRQARRERKAALGIYPTTFNRRSIPNPTSNPPRISVVDRSVNTEGDLNSTPQEIFLEIPGFRSRRG